MIEVSQLKFLLRTRSNALEPVRRQPCGAGRWTNRRLSLPTLARHQTTRLAPATDHSDSNSRPVMVLIDQRLDEPIPWQQE